MTNMSHVVKHLAVQLLSALRPGPAAPPEEVSVVFVEWPPKNRDICLLQFVQIKGGCIEILGPTPVKRGVWGCQFEPLIVSEVSFDAVLESHYGGDRLIVNGAHYMPG